MFSHALVLDIARGNGVAHPIPIPFRFIYDGFVCSNSITVPLCRLLSREWTPLTAWDVSSVLRLCDEIYTFSHATKSNIHYHKCNDFITFSHYGDVIISTMVSQITSLAIVYSTVYSGAEQRKHKSSASLAFVRGIHRWPVNSPHKGLVTRKMFPLDDVVMNDEFKASFSSPDV